MKILMVADAYDEINNGVTISIRRMVNEMRKMGLEIRILAAGQSENVDYSVPALKIPIFQYKIDEQGMVLGVPDEEVMQEALAWCDIVHFAMPFRLSRNGLKWAEKMNVPHTTAFHIQPENITYNIKMGNLQFANNLTYRIFRKFFNRFDHVHVPSEFIAEQLHKHEYTAKIHVISNGVDPIFRYRKIAKPEELKDRIIIPMIGRLSPEKRQDLLIDAALKSRHSDKIQIMLAGRGPEKSRYQEMGKNLNYAPIINFYSQEDLLDVLSFADLYVHASDIEAEAISCIEAIATGLVPVISNSDKSATPQFALDDRSLFKPGNSADLARHIDYWLEHEKERKDMEKQYAKAAEKYSLHHSTKLMLEMFEEAIRDHNK